MKAVGIIAEYNPFHNGHAHQIATIRQKASCDVVIAAISGHFTQRGETASFTKWQRANLALLGGADLVVELPFVFAVRSGAYFATGGVRLLDALGVSYLSFGAESTSLAPLLAAAHAQLSPTLGTELAPYLAQGMPYAAALTHLLDEQYQIPPAITSSPNNILAIEYMKAILSYAPHITPLHIVRHGSSHHSDSLDDSALASSSAIRAVLSEKSPTLERLTPYIPPVAMPYLSRYWAENGGLANLELLSPLVFGLLHTTDKTRLIKTAGIAEGLENKFLSASLTANTIDNLLNQVKSKRYPRTRLNRILLHYIFGSTKDMIARFDAIGPQYIRILGMNERGQAYLRERKKKTQLPIITKLTSYFNQYDLLSPGKDPFKSMLALDVRSANVYARLFDTPLAMNQDFTTSPIRLSISE